MSVEGYGVKDTDAILNNEASIQEQDGSDDSKAETTESNSQNVEVYHRRWYILAVFSLLNLAQGK